jgi:hypothetical protein
MNTLLEATIKCVFTIYLHSEVVKITNKLLRFVSLNIYLKVHFTMKETDFSSSLLSVLEL